MTTGGPLLSACLIVRDEEANLTECLAALRGVVDEVVVYDTGSTDATVALARRLGAAVAEGYWDDDFARARNAALERCSAPWILHVDADEVLDADARLLRGALEGGPDVDALTVEIYNLVGDGTTPGYTHRGTRIFRADRCHWRGRLHEQVMLRPGITGQLRVLALEGARIVHTGYLDGAMEERGKLARNLRVAEAANLRVAESADRRMAESADLRGAQPAGNCDPGADPEAEAGLVELNLGRCLAAVGRFDEAVVRYREADAVITAPPARRMVRMHAAEACLALGRPDEALGWVDRLREVSAAPAIADLLEAQARTVLGEPERGVELLRRIDVPANEDGYRLPEGTVEMTLADALLAAGEVGEAADILLAVVERATDLRTVAALADALARAGRSLEELARVLPESGLLRAAAALTVIDPGQADRVAEELLTRFGPRPPLLAAAVRFAPRLPLERALAWSARLRAAGIIEDCPTRAQASHHPSPAARARAAAALAAAFADPCAPDLLRSAVATTPDAALADLVVQLAALGALDAGVLAAAATSGPRCRILAETMHSGGAEDVARSLLGLADAFVDGSLGKSGSCSQVRSGTRR